MYSPPERSFKLLLPHLYLKFIENSTRRTFAFPEIALPSNSADVAKPSSLSLNNFSVFTID